MTSGRCFILFYLLFSAAFVFPAHAISDESGTSKDMEVVGADAAASAGAAVSAPGQMPAAAEIIAENLVGEKVEDTAADEEDEEDESEAEECVISCRTKVAFLETTEDGSVMMDQISTVTFACPLPIREAFDRTMKSIEKELDPDKVAEVSVTCEFP